MSLKLKCSKCGFEESFDSLDDSKNNFYAYQSGWRVLPRFKGFLCPRHAEEYHKEQLRQRKKQREL